MTAWLCSLFDFPVIAILLWWNAVETVGFTAIRRDNPGQNMASWTECYDAGLRELGLLK